MYKLEKWQNALRDPFGYQKENTAITLLAFHWEGKMGKTGHL